jgi:hypothetical protein
MCTTKAYENIRLSIVYLHRILPQGLIYLHNSSNVRVLIATFNCSCFTPCTDRFIKVVNWEQKVFICLTVCLCNNEHHANICNDLFQGLLLLMPIYMPRYLPLLRPGAGQKRTLYFMHYHFIIYMELWMFSCVLLQLVAGIPTFCKSM